MYKGDLSNELSKRVLVVIDIFTDIEINIKKVFKILPVTSKTKNYNRAILSKLYLFTTRVGKTLELVSFDLTQDELGLEIEKIEQLGTNPFRYFTAYDSPEHLSSELPYRPEVIGVLDLPSRLLRYGHWGLDMSQL
jgi:hypothetical protein